MPPEETVLLGNWCAQLWAELCLQGKGVTGQKTEINNEIAAALLCIISNVAAQTISRKLCLFSGQVKITHNSGTATVKVGKREVLNYVTWLSYSILLPSVSSQGVNKAIITISFVFSQFIAHIL